ncbi:inner centromere protein-like [Panonychus citri]|uniref:inner centromere protein-like n=1 Tax=Panonychus citri TaxID=50023 RepID=UPI0023076C64|nr:inner centromere protein-like [Panonychus citri]
MTTGATLLGCDFVDSALNSLGELWKQHVATLENTIEKFTRELSLSTSKQGSEPRVTRARAKKDEEISPVESNNENQPPTKSSEIKQESEWTTDDSFESIDSIGDETYQRMILKKSPNSSHKVKTVKKRKQTEYFTPSIPHKSSRITRATANKITPEIGKTKISLLTKASSSVTKSSNGTTTSGSSIASSQATIASVGRSDSVKGKKPIPKTCTTPDTKTLTASAAKRRLEEEEKRKANLAQMKEKEEKVIQNKQENLKIKAQMTKLKNEEKRRRIEQMKRKEEEELREKRLKEQSKLEEIEKRRKEKEEARRRELQRNQEAAKKKQIEFDLRKQQEEEERKARLLKQEEQNKQKKIENERIRIEQDKILKMIAQHNSNFQKGQNTSATQQKVDHPGTFKQPLPPTPSEVQPALPLNRTFSVDKEGESVMNEKELVKKEGESAKSEKESATKEAKPIKVESYQITPPPKPKPKQMPVNYDISDIKSDDDTDDEERPRKLIPSWAKGDALIAALDKQFAKSRRARERQIREIFPCYDYTIDLIEIFNTNRVVHPKYDKRTSSAVWSSPPCNSTINYSMITDDI